MDIGIDKLDFAKAVAVGVNNPDYREYFEELYYLDEFNVFKSWMIKKNAQMNYEALLELEKQGFKSEGNEDKEQDPIYLKKEMSDLDHAIAISKQKEDEMKQIESKEDEDFREALRLSELSYKMDQEKRTKEETQKPKEAAPVPVPVPTPAQTESKPAPQKINHPLLQQLEQEKAIQQKVKEAVPTHAEPPKESSLPALNMKGGLGFKKLPELSELQKRRDEVANDLAKKKDQEEQNKALIEERKKRILEQREKLQEQKKQEREAELQKYEEYKVVSILQE